MKTLIASLLCLLLCNVPCIAGSTTTLPATVDYESLITTKTGKGKKAELKARMSITKFATKFVGKKYRYGALGPNQFDCSGYTKFIFQHYDINLGRSSGEQSKKGRVKRISQLKKADLVFFGTKRKVQHVGIVVEASKGRLMVAHCSSSRGVIIENVLKSSYWKERILFGKDVINN